MSKHYTFTKSGVHAFLSDVIDETLEDGIYHDIVISYGEKAIKIPMFPETYEALEQFLPDAEQLYREEYEEVENE